MDRRVRPVYQTARDWFAADAAGPIEPPARVFELRDFIAIVRQRWMLVAFCIGAGATAAGLYGLTAPKRYVATAELLVDTRGVKVVEGDVNQRFENAETLTADLESQIRIVSSGSVLRSVAERERLGVDPDFVPRAGLLGRLKSLVTGAPSGPADPDAVAAAILEKSVTVRRSERSFVIDISVAAASPEKAARLAQAVAETYIETQIQNRQLVTKRLGEEVAARLKDLRTQLEAAEKRLEDYRNNNNLQFANGKLALDQDVTELTTQLNQARARTARARARVDQIRALPANPASLDTLSEVLDSPTIVQLRLRLAEATRQESELRQSLGPLHPELATANARVAEARRAIELELARRRQSAEAELAQATGAEKAMAAQIEQTKKLTTSAGQSLIGARELERAADANRKVYEQFLVRAREITEQAGFQPNLSRVISPATEPVVPVGLSALVLAALGGFVGAPLGVGLAVLAHFATSLAGAPGVRRSRRRGRAQPVAFAEIERAFVHHYVARRKFNRASTPPPTLVELAGRIERLNTEDPLRILLVASAEQRDTGSEFVLALAGSYAWEGLDVIAIDGDPQHAGLSQLMSLNGNSGLYDPLGPRAGIEDRIVAGRSGLPHLVPATNNPGKTVNSDVRHDLVQRLERLCAGVDLVVVDAGLAASNPFAALLAEAASDCIVVADMTKADPERVTAAVDALYRAGAPEARIVSINGDATPSKAVVFGSQVESANADDHHDHGKKRWHFGRKRIVGQRQTQKA